MDQKQKKSYCFSCASLAPFERIFALQPRGSILIYTLHMLHLYFRIVLYYYTTYPDSHSNNNRGHILPPPAWRFANANNRPPTNVTEARYEWYDQHQPRDS